MLQRRQVSCFRKAYINTAKLVFPVKSGDIQHIVAGWRKVLRKRIKICDIQQIQQKIAVPKCGKHNGMLLFRESQPNLLQDMNDSRSTCTVNVLQFLRQSLLNGRCYIGAILLHKRSLRILPQLRHPQPLSQTVQMQCGSVLLLTP